jgi:hypothetical protein
VEDLNDREDSSDQLIASTKHKRCGGVLENKGSLVYRSSSNDGEGSSCAVD